MSDAQVGINLNLNENASVAAPKIVESFRKIGDAGEKAGQRLQGAFADAGLESSFNTFSDKVDRVYQREMARSAQGGRGKGPPPTDDGGGRQSNILQFPQRFAQGAGGAIQTATSAATTAGRGDAFGAGASLTRGVGQSLGALKGLGGVGAIAGGALAVGGLAAFGANELSKLYEEVIPQTMNLTAAFGELKDSAQENTVSFRRTMEMASDSAARFGYSLDQGTQVFQELSRVMRRGQAGEEAANIFGYARGFGVGPTEVGRFVGRGRQFGMQGDLPGLVAGGLQASGMEAGRFQEYMQATTAIFEEALSQGVVRGFEDISRTQNFFAQIGPTFQGSEGAQRISQMNAAIRSGTSLQSEEDVLRFAGFRGLGQAGLQRMLGGRMYGNYIDVMRAMEGGINSDAFRSIGQQIQGMTGGNETQMIEMFRQTFGVNYTVGSDLYELFRSGRMEEAASRLEAPDAQSNEQRLLTLQEQISQEVRSIATSVTDVKVTILDGANNIVTGLADALGVHADQVEEAQKVKEAAELYRSLLRSGGEGLSYADLLSGFGPGSAMSEMDAVLRGSGRDTVSSMLQFYNQLSESGQMAQVRHGTVNGRDIMTTAYQRAMASTGKTDVFDEGDFSAFQTELRTLLAESQRNRTASENLMGYATTMEYRIPYRRRGSVQFERFDPNDPMGSSGLGPDIERLMRVVQSGAGTGGSVGSASASLSALFGGMDAQTFRALTPFFSMAEEVGKRTRSEPGLGLLPRFSESDLPELLSLLRALIEEIRRDQGGATQEEIMVMIEGWGE